MNKTTYELTVPALKRGLAVLSTYIEKAKKNAADRGVAEAEVLDARLSPDMLPFSAQIQRASDKAKAGVARLAGISAPTFDDNEKSFDELTARIAKTVAFIESVKPEQFEGADSREVELRFRSVSGKLAGFTYLTQILLPDFYFHVATAHGILRSLGLPIGKIDYIGVPDYL